MTEVTDVWVMRSKETDLNDGTVNDVTISLPSPKQSGAKFLEVPMQNGSKSDTMTKKDTSPDIRGHKDRSGKSEDAASNLDVVSMRSDGLPLSRTRSFIRRLTTRRRAVRNGGMAGANINRAPGYESYERKNGGVLTAEEKLRMYTLKEIVKTEEEYTQLLQCVVEVIIPSLSRCAMDCEIKSVSRDTVKRMFSNVEEIYKLHTEFAKAMKEATFPFPYHTHCLGDVFLKYENAFHVYEDYCSNFSDAQKLCYQVEADEEVRNMINEWKQTVESNTRKLIHLEGFLIAPVQRICKYPLLLRELAKYTNESHPDHKKVRDAKDMMEIVTSSVNEAERRKIIIEAIRDLETTSDLWEKDGCVSKQGFITKRMRWFKSWSIQWVIIDGYDLMHYNQPTDVKAAGRIDLNLCKKILVDTTSITGKPFSFGIEMPRQVHYFYCTSESEKQEWLTVFQWKMACVERGRRQASKPMETAVIATLSSLMNPVDVNSPRKRSSTTIKQKNKIHKNRAKSMSAIQGKS